MVGCPPFAPEAMDDSTHRAAIKKHNPRFDHTLCVEWNCYLDNGDPVVNKIGKYYTHLWLDFRIDERWPNHSLVCPASCRLLIGESPVVVTARKPRSRHPVHQKTRISFMVSITLYKHC